MKATWRKAYYGPGYPRARPEPVEFLIQPLVPPSPGYLAHLEWLRRYCSNLAEVCAIPSHLLNHEQTEP